MLYVGYTRKNLEELCDKCYTKQKYLKTYSSMIHPLSNTNVNPRNKDENLRPPPLKRLLRRPRKNRRKEEGEPIGKKRSTNVRCDNYKGFDHNQRTCQHAPMEKMV